MMLVHVCLPHVKICCDLFTTKLHLSPFQNTNKARTLQRGKSFRSKTKYNQL